VAQRRKYSISSDVWTRITPTTSRLCTSDTVTSARPFEFPEDDVFRDRTHASSSAGAPPAAPTRATTLPSGRAPSSPGLATDPEVLDQVISVNESRPRSAVLGLGSVGSAVGDSTHRHAPYFLGQRAGRREALTASPGRDGLCRARSPHDQTHRQAGTVASRVANSAGPGSCSMTHQGSWRSSSAALHPPVATAMVLAPMA